MEEAKRRSVLEGGEGGVEELGDGGGDDTAEEGLPTEASGPVGGQVFHGEKEASYWTIEACRHTCRHAARGEGSSVRFGGLGVCWVVGFVELCSCWVVWLLGLWVCLVCWVCWVVGFVGLLGC